METASGSKQGNRARLSVRVKPRSSVSRVAGFEGGTLVVRVGAPPVDGLANRAVCELVAELVGVSKSSVKIERGERSRDKVVAVDGISQERVDMVLAKLGREQEGQTK
ncbi:MAG: DUF167 domain-containing protein [Firmicutes bacterium]|jgi:uncharacterized protein (TIGR00251 family)|nr:DUF167 domain-containing protein [Bacillota bacterium]MDH7496440.1 DUF167 domain-containing protein [Bacillota bacterium]